MKTQVTQELIDNIIEDYKVGSSIETLCKKYHLGKLKVKAILDDNGVHRRSYTESKEINRLPEDRAPKYLPVDGKHYVCTCTVDGYQTNDYMNKGGFLTSHIKEVLGIETPTLWDRKKYYNATGNYWWEQWFKVELVDDKPTIKCPYCEWTSEDVDNRSGMFETHLRKVHGIDKVMFVTEHPEWREYFRTANKTIDRQMETDESKFVVCKVCGKKLSRIDWKHLQSHGLTIDEYKQKYGGRTLSAKLRMRMKEVATLGNIALENHPVSIYESELMEFIKQYCPDAKRDRSILSGQELDVYIPSRALAIEFNGCMWHSEYFGHKSTVYHLAKTELCEEEGVRLIHIFEDEWILHKDLVKQKLRHILGVNNSVRIPARKCIIKELDVEEAKTFFEKNHLNGFSYAGIHIGLFYGDELVSAASFRTINKHGDWELSRFATDTNRICSGACGKLLKYFINKEAPLTIVSYADRRWSQSKDNMYEKIGFTFSGYTKPLFKYYNPKVDRVKRLHERTVRNLLIKEGWKKTNLSKGEMARQLGYDRIWDCGLIRYLWVNDHINESNK